MEEINKQINNQERVLDRIFLLTNVFIIFLCVECEGGGGGCGGKWVCFCAVHILSHT